MKPTKLRTKHLNENTTKGWEIVVCAESAITRLVSGMEKHTLHGQQAMSYLDVIEKSQVIYVPFYIQPLNVLKQIVCMGLSASMAGSRSYPELSGFVLNPRIRTFPSGYSCYVYLTNKKSVARYCTEGGCLILRLEPWITLSRKSLAAFWLCTRSRDYGSKVHN